MTIVVVGLNYRTAPIEIREKLTLSGFALHLALGELRGGVDTHDTAHPPSSAPIDEVVILSTCNRLEIIVSAPHVESATAHIERFLCDTQTIDPETLREHLYSYSADEAVHHLMHVACGLDSMILGEAQILGQITQAYESALHSGTVGAVLSHLFAQVIHTGKRAHTETAIGRHTTSVSHAGALLLLDKLQDPQRARVLVIGAGEMAVLAAQALTRYDVRTLAFMNRTQARAETLAQQFGGQALSWYQFDEALTWADAVICATGAPHTVLHRYAIEMVQQRRQYRPMVIMDIAVPRDVEISVNQVANVQVYDIDDLQSVVDNNIEMRRAAMPQVETIIQQEMARFGEWYHSRQVTPVIKTLREWAQGIADEELVQTLNRLSNADERTRQTVTRLAHRLVNRLLHEPTSRLRIQASEGNACGYAYAVRELFALDALDNIECQHYSQQCTDTPNSHTQSASQSCTLHCILPHGTEH
mgnify:CR=1 FL=1